MRRAFLVRLLSGGLAAGAVSAQACSSDTGRAPAIGSGGSAHAQGGAGPNSGGRSGGATAQGGDSGASSGGDPSDAGHPGSAGVANGGSVGQAGGGATDAGGVGGEGGVPPNPYSCPSDTNAEPSPSFASQCDPEMTWGKGALVPVDAGDGDQLVAVTPDELTIVWFDSRGSVGTFRLADRSASDAAFQAAAALDAGNVIALSPDGLRLAALSSDQSVLVEYVRPTRAEAFGAGQDGAFSALNADALAKGYRVLDALIAPDDETLYYNVFTGEELEYSLHVSSRSGAQPWPVGQPIEACELKAFGSLVRHPTGASADGLTLFFYDPTRNAARAAFRRTAGGPFVWFSDLGPLYQAMPNQSCDRLYYWASDAESSIFVAAAE